jgi:hypothetical protein
LSSVCYQTRDIIIGTAQRMAHGEREDGCQAVPMSSKLDLLCDAERVIYLDTQIAHGAFKL